MNQPYDPMEDHIQKCRQRVAQEGYGHCDSTEVILAGFGWLADRIAPVKNHRLARRAAQVAVPTASGGGVIAIVLYVLQLFAK